MSFFTEEQVEAFSQKTVRMDFLVKFEFISEDVYVWNGEYKLTIGGNVYLPMHGMGKIEGLSATTTAASESISMSLNGLPNQEPDLFSLALSESSEANQQLVTVSLMMFDEHWQKIGDTPITVWWGFMQPPRINSTPANELEGGSQVISITAENAFFNRSRPPYGRYTDRDQQAQFPGDSFFGFTGSLLFKTITYPDY